MKLIVGLGNPGKKYEKTRHNVGFMVLDKLKIALGEYDTSNWDLGKKFNAVICGTSIRGEKIILAKPMTFMNGSGQAVQILAHYYKISPSDIIVVHDDKDIKLGEIKIQKGKNAAGHNGVASIIQNINSKDFIRVRVGIAGNDRKMKDTAKFVLGKFGLLEKKTLNKIIEESIEEIKKLI